MDSLVHWKDKQDRKPLILFGARQTGKTWILKEFGKRYFKNVAYINCDNNAEIKDLFAEDYNTDRIIMTISAATNETIVPGNTLIILDEIQETKRGLASLKYFSEDAPEYHVAVAGSYLGIQLREGESYPVGKVDTLTLYPMDFEEFLNAKGETRLLKVLKHLDFQMISSLSSRFIQLLREYYFVGGMPEAVKKFIQTKDPNAVREIQKEILQAYRQDLSKHSPVKEVARINQVWQSIPSQLAKENKKFIYGALAKGARAKDYEIAIQWLIDSGLIYKVSRIKAAEIPLSNYEDISAFKLYMLDNGLLGALGNTPAVSLLLPGGLGQSKGAFTENFVCAQIKEISDTTLGYFSKDNSRLEIDFVLQISDLVIPIEVKAEENLKSKSLATFVKDNPKLRGIRFSMSNYREQEYLSNVPLYCCNTYLKAFKKNREMEIQSALARLGALI